MNMASSGFKKPRTGYKQTAVGIIPDNWDVEIFGDMFAVSGGFSASRDQLSQKGYCYLHYGDIHKSAKTFIDVRSEYMDIPKLDIALKRISPKSLLNDGDVVFVDASEDDEGASKHIVVVNKEDIPFISGLHTIVAKSKGANPDQGFRRYCFQTHDVKRQFYFYSVGTKVTGISKSNIAKILVPLPSPPEQRAIAAVLSDVDALINSLDRLIAKKRNIKQAVMQELLTCRQRLRGFRGEWSFQEIGSVFGVSAGGDFDPSRSSATRNETYRYPIYSNALSEGGLYGFCSYAEHSANSITITARGTLGVAWYRNHEYTAIGRVVILEPKKTLDSRFFSFYINSRIKFVVESTGVPQLTAPQLSKYVVAVPSLDEQTAIATILSDMDAEIVALKKKRDKTMALKQGIMQELLTGRIRLVAPSGQ